MKSLTSNTLWLGYIIESIINIGYIIESIFNIGYIIESIFNIGSMVTYSNFRLIVVQAVLTWGNKPEGSTLTGGGGS